MDLHIATCAGCAIPILCDKRNCVPANHLCYACSHAKTHTSLDVQEASAAA